MIDLNLIAKECDYFSHLREKNGAFQDDDLLKHCSGEVVEAVESRIIFNTYMKDKTTTPEEKKVAKDDFANELMDILYCVLVQCSRSEIDPEKALEKNIDKNRKRALGQGDKK